jgi:hypothetical protein
MAERGNCFSYFMGLLIAGILLTLILSFVRF